jgi:hypothetical protein
MTSTRVTTGSDGVGVVGARSQAIASASTRIEDTVKPASALLMFMA